MNVKAINGLSVSSFQGKAHRSQKDQHNKQEINPNYNTRPSYNSSDAMRNLVLGLMALGATAGSLSSCSDDIIAEASSSSSASSSANASIQIGGHWHHHDTVTVIKPDTIHDTDTVIHT